MASAGAAEEYPEDTRAQTDKLADGIVQKLNGHPIGIGIIALTKVLILALMQIPDAETRLTAYRRMSARVGRVLRNLSVEPEEEEKPKKKKPTRGKKK